MESITSDNAKPKLPAALIAAANRSITPSMAPPTLITNSLANDIETSVRKYTYYNSKADDNAKYYFLFEVGIHDAFAHWVFESAIFLQYLKRIEKELNRKLTLVIKKNPSRTYKSLFFKLFNVDNDITKEDNHYIDNKKDFVHSQQYTPYEIEENNICIG